MKNKTVSDKQRGSSNSNIPENLDLHKLDYSEFSGEMLGILFLEAIQRDDERAQWLIANEIFDTL